MRISKRSKSLTSLNWAWGIGGAGGAPPRFDRNRSKTVSFQRHVQIIPFGCKFGSLTIRKSGKVYSFFKTVFSQTLFDAKKWYFPQTFQLISAVVRLKVLVKVPLFCVKQRYVVQTLF